MTAQQTAPILRKPCMPTRRPPLERFKEKMGSPVQRREGMSPCVEWQAGKQGDGYGCFGMHRRSYLAHRAAWELFIGPLPDGNHVLHRCDNPPCVNVEHLFLGTHDDNMKDMAAKGRSGNHKGTSNGRARLKEADVPAVRTMLAGGMSQSEVARVYGVSQTAISGIIVKRTWRHVA